jgi:hypothetical protein
LEYATHLHVKRRIQVQIDDIMSSKSVIYRVFIPGGFAVIYTEFYQAKNPEKLSRVFIRLSQPFEAAIKKDSEKLSKKH